MCVSFILCISCLIMLHNVDLPRFYLRQCHHCVSLLLCALISYADNFRLELRDLCFFLGFFCGTEKKTKFGININRVGHLHTRRH